MSFSLAEVDSLEAVVIIDNEVDPLSWIAPDTVDVSGRFPDVMLSESKSTTVGENTIKVMPLEAMCCGAHGLSVLVTATKDGVKHSVLFDTGPEEEAWERNAKRLGTDISIVEVIHLSHWHRDHSGGMIKAIEMISEAKKSSATAAAPVIVDLHPNRPEYRGFTIGNNPVSFSTDPTFAEIERAGGVVSKNSAAHTVLDNMFLISGFIPASAPYEKGLKGGIRIQDTNKGWEKDEEMADERFLMCNVKGKGIVMFTGCSHRGVVNASRSAVELLGSTVPLHAVLGGYHLVGSSKADVEATVKDLKALNPKVCLPGHCSGWRVKYEIEKEMPGRASVALITASSAGLGAATAKELAASGIRVVINYNSNREKAAAVLKELQALQPSSSTSTDTEPRFHIIRADVSQRASLISLVEETVKVMGRLDLVVSNHGWTKIRDFANLDDNIEEEDWDRCFNMNVKSHLWLFHAARKYLEETEGSFITTASVAGVIPGGSSMAYSVTKAAQIHLAKGLAKIAGPKVRVNSVSPGLLMTEWGHQFPQAKIDKTTNKSVLKRVATVEDVARQILCLANSSSQTGTNAVIEAGLLLG
ncbi:Granaticin polyketide synthase putative ketoacyl reductase [Lachnellula suecica]|uniref:Granaticin polyketide synthase putative ketoacyl reductase n=1 Tax=Lachnellula suecica TaxID=602035 RepID=A0A8T9CLG8_9HELO|nr:Granaticin polyketide synthase putative ketoacyl reductase [Lachnellula suecica]